MVWREVKGRTQENASCARELIAGGVCYFVDTCAQRTYDILVYETRVIGFDIDAKKVRREEGIKRLYEWMGWQNEQG